MKVKDHMHIFVRAAAVTAAAVMFAGCGSSDSSSENSEPISDRTLAADFSDHLNNGDYDISMTITGDTAISGTKCRMIRHGSDGLVSMDNNDVYTEFYTVDGQSYMVMPVIQCYRTSDETGSFGNAFIRIGKGDDLFDVQENDDSVIEVYTSTSGGVREKFTFTFEKPALKLTKVVSESEKNVITTDISDVSYESEPIELPDFTEWDNISDDVSISDVTQIKFSLYTRGIDPDMVAAAGYTYKELAKMPSEQTDSIAEEILSGTASAETKTESSADSESRSE